MRKQGTIRKTYTIHLKLAVKEIREGLMTQVDVAEKYGISTSTISDWCKKENQGKYFDMASRGENLSTKRIDNNERLISGIFNCWRKVVYN